ncbi:hypothetical protein RQP46_010534 [Phenoliferia psychrophenolica]
MSGNAYCACCTGTDLKHSRPPPPPLAILDDATFIAQLATKRSASVAEKYLASATTGPTVFRVVPFGAAMTQCFRDRGLVDAEGVPAFELKFDVQTDAWLYIAARVEDQLHIMSADHWIMAIWLTYPSYSHRMVGSSKLELAIVPLASLAEHMRLRRPARYSSWRLIKPKSVSAPNPKDLTIARFNLTSPFPGPEHPGAVWAAYYRERMALERIQADDPKEAPLFYPVKGDEYRHRVRTLPLTLLTEAGMPDPVARLWADGVLLAYWQGSGSAGFEFSKGYHSVVGRIYSPFTLQRVEIAMYYYHRSYSYGYETWWALGYRVIEPTAKEHGTEWTTELFKWSPSCMFDARGETNDWKLIAHGLEEPDYSGGGGGWGSESDGESATPTVKNVFGLKSSDVDLITGILGGPDNEFVKAIGAEDDKPKARRTTLQLMLASIAVAWEVEEDLEDDDGEGYGEMNFSFGDRPDGNFDEGDWLGWKMDQLIDGP